MCWCYGEGQLYLLVLPCMCCAVERDTAVPACTPLYVMVLWRVTAVPDCTPLYVLVVWSGKALSFLYFPFDIVLTPGLSIPFGLLPSDLLIKIKYAILNLSHLCDICCSSCPRYRYANGVL
jgi:hypothetical protein